MRVAESERTSQVRRCTTNYKWRRSVAVALAVGQPASASVNSIGPGWSRALTTGSLQGKPRESWASHSVLAALHKSIEAAGLGTPSDRDHRVTARREREDCDRGPLDFLPDHAPVPHVGTGSITGDHI